MSCSLTAHSRPKFVSFSPWYDFRCLPQCSQPFFPQEIPRSHGVLLVVMCRVDYAYFGPALLVLPLFAISLINLFVAGPPLKTIVLDSVGPQFGASLPFMKLDVVGSTAKFTLWPDEEMTHFFVITTYLSRSEPAAPFALDVSVTGKKPRPGDAPDKPALSEKLYHMTSADAVVGDAGAQTHLTGTPTLQLLQPLLGFREYDVVIRSMKDHVTEANLPAMEYRLTYVPTRFTYAQMIVRAFFTLTSVAMLTSYSAVMCMVRSGPLERTGNWCPC